MRYRIYMKLILCYLVGSIIMFGTVNIYGVREIERKLIREEKDDLYEKAEGISRLYVTPFYMSPMNWDDVSRMNSGLRTITALTGIRIWVVNNQGMVVTDTTGNAGVIRLDIHTFDESFLDNRYIEGAYYAGVFAEPMLCVVENVVRDYSVRGYVCLIISMKSINDRAVYIMEIFNTCLLILLAVLFLLFSYIYFFTHRPVSKMTKATKEYLKGNYDVHMNVRSRDEYRELADTMEFLMKLLRNKDDYQRKFVANISHDFRSPLTSIGGYAQALKDGTIPYDAQDKYLDIILFETARLNKLTNDLLTLNGFEQAGMFLDIRSFDINEMIKNTVAAFEGVCTERKIVFKLQFFDKETYVDADVGKIQQVLYNLIDNAVKFSHNDSSIRINIEERGNKVNISIRDYGMGIPKDNISKIWERFYKSDLSRGKDKKGTGLGLSIAKEIMTAHKENISVISTEGVGTEFIFALRKSELG